MDLLKKFDTPEINSYVFHPSKASPDSSDVKRIKINVDENIIIGASLFEASKEAPFILYFHGNGEIVNDYDELGLVFAQQNINFMPVDYRGYGFSNGTPTLSSMISDAGKIGDFVHEYRKENNFTGKFAVMGRSLGSASAIELGYSKDYFDALIIESGFFSFKKLLRNLGFYNEKYENFDDPLNHEQKVSSFKNPVLIIHGEFDEIIPFSEGRKLFENSGAENKKLVKIPGAGHNTIFSLGLNEYFASIVNLLF
ncbi:MAG: alpha/beta hydrolase [Desulforegulaceae bacterium]|nr:alpha/beta hydrolase [Desulforegulaceae bacterium]